MFLKKCRLCESKKLFKFLDLGFHPPSDQFKKKIELNNKFDLSIPTYGNKTKYNKSTYINNFNSNSINKINKLYQKDFEYFNYEMLQ